MGVEILNKQEQILGKRIQEYRKNAGFTQQNLCEQTGLSFSTLAKIERGAIKSPSVFTVQSIANCLHVSMDELVGGTRLHTPAINNFKTSRSGVKFVFFDVNGCVVRFSQRAFNKIAEDYGVSLDVVESVFWHYNDSVCRGETSLEDFNLFLSKKLGVKSIDWSSYYLAAAEQVPGMTELLLWARDNYHVGLLTNIMPGLLASMLNSGQVPNIPYDAVIDSSQVGSIKPEKKIYEIAMKASGHPGSEILLIDDTRANLIAAEKLGWRVIWYDYARPEESIETIKQALLPAD